MGTIEVAHLDFEWKIQRYGRCIYHMNVDGQSIAAVVKDDEGRFHVHGPGPEKRPWFSIKEEAMAWAEAQYILTSRPEAPQT